MFASTIVAIPLRTKQTVATAWAVAARQPRAAVRGARAAAPVRQLKLPGRLPVPLSVACAGILRGHIDSTSRAIPTLPPTPD